MKGMCFNRIGDTQVSPAYAVLKNPFEPGQKVGALLSLQAFRAQRHTADKVRPPAFLCWLKE